MRFNDREKKSKYYNNFIVRQQKLKQIWEFVYLIGEHEKSINSIGGVILSLLV